MVSAEERFGFPSRSFLFSETLGPILSVFLFVPKNACSQFGKHAWNKGQVYLFLGTSRFYLYKTSLV